MWECCRRLHTLPSGRERRIHLPIRAGKRRGLSIRSRRLGFLRQLFQADGGVVAGANVRVPCLMLPLPSPSSAPGTHWPSSRKLMSGCA